MSAKPLQALRRAIAALMVFSLFLLAVHDLAHAREKHPAQDHCPVCALIARTASHTAKIAPRVVSRSFLVVLAVSPRVKPVRLRLARASSRDPPAA